MTYKQGKRAEKILAQQNRDGSWGNAFHSLAQTTGGTPPCTEQALRALELLGFTKEDTPIKRVLSHLRECLQNPKLLPGKREVTHNWDLFTQLMTSTWILRFDPSDSGAGQFANRWQRVIHAAFAGGPYSHTAYHQAYSDEFGIPPVGARFEDFVSFYTVSLLTGRIDPAIEAAYFQYIWEHPGGIYYITRVSLNQSPAQLSPQKTIRFLAAVRLLCAYPGTALRPWLEPVWVWLKENQVAPGKWDMGAAAKDGVYLPLCDSWRRTEDRVTDCTHFINPVKQRCKTLGIC